MNRPIRELKRIARGNLNNRYRIPMEAFILVIGLTLAIELPFSMLQSQYNTLLQDIVFYLADFLISLLAVILTVGQIKLHLHMARHQEISSSMVFWGFKNHPDRIIIVGFIISLLHLLSAIPSYFAQEAVDAYLTKIGFTDIFTLSVKDLDWALFSSSLAKCLLLVLAALVIDVIITLFFQLPYYLIVDHVEMPALECIKVGLGLMKGHKLRLFLLMLSFIGMDILMVLSLGIGALWIIPYKKQTYALFYLDIIGEVPSEIDSFVNEESLSPFQSYM